MSTQLKFELAEHEKTSGIAPQLLKALVELSNKIAHMNQDPKLSLSQLNYSQGMYAGYATIIRALEDAGAQCPTR